MGYDVAENGRPLKITPTDIITIDRTLSQIKLPHEIHKWLHLLSNPSKLEASEWKSFLLIHAIVLQQISKRTLQLMSLSFPDKIMSGRASTFCRDLTSPYELKYFYRDGGTDAICIGEKGNLDGRSDGVRIFDRCVYKN